MTSDKELWALALWVEKHHGEDAPRFIAEKLGEFALAGEAGGVDMWRAVAERSDALKARADQPAN